MTRQGAGADELRQASWLHVQEPANLAITEQLGGLSPADRAAIALAYELSGVLLVDEQRAHRVASRLGIPVIRTGVVLVAAKRAGLIPEVRPLLDEIRDAGVHLGDETIRAILGLAGENP